MTETTETTEMTEFTTNMTKMAEFMTESKTDMEALLATLKSLEPSELFKVMKQALSEAEKRCKTTVSKPAKKSMPKGKVPRQLMRPRAWVEFTLKHALENGWEAFTVHQTKKNKETGEKFEEEILQPGSILYEGAHVYEDSVTEKNPNGKQLIHKDAMSLSKQRWAPKEATGTHQELYEEFLTTYVEDTVSETSETKVVKMTAAEKAALAEEKKAEKLREKEEKKAEKLREKEEKKAEKLREKEEKKAEKLREKMAKVPAAAIAKAPVKAVIPAKALVKAVTPVTPAKAPVKATPVTPLAKPVAKPVAKPLAKPLAKEWTCPADDMVHPWPYNGKNYLRNSDNEVWARGTDGGCGEWQGIYLPAEDRIDDSVAEPEFEDE